MKRFGAQPKPIEERLWSKVTKMPSGCWIYQGNPSQRYAVIHINDGPGRNFNVLAHRYVHEKYKGPIPEGYVIDHTCHSNDLSCPGDDTCPHRRCLNPDHLEAVPTKTNLLRGRGAPAANARKQFCDWGHPLSGDNMRFEKGFSGPQRVCRICAKRRKQESADRKANKIQMARS